MAESFSVGEIGIIVSAGSAHPDWVGCEVTILSPLKNCPCFRNGGIEYLPSYETTHPLGLSGTAYVTPHRLRKRRPPQDWVKLCDLTDTPREVETV